MERALGSPRVSPYLCSRRLAGRRHAAAAPHAQPTARAPPQVPAAAAGRGRMVVAVTSVTEEEQRQQQPGASTSAPAKAGASKWVIDESELLTSTNEHRAYTLGSIALMGATFAHALAGCHDAGDYTSVGASFLAAYVLSDLGTGIYHWSVDNYGDGNTPLVRGAAPGIVLWGQGAVWAHRALLLPGAGGAERALRAAGARVGGLCG
jgi:hypothetical protein